MASKRLTDIGSATGVTLSDFIHIVDPNDLSQDPAGSSYKATLQQVYDAFNISGTTSGTSFIHEYTVFVDPNGNDSTGEYGNINKPFKTPMGALLSAIDKMRVPGFLAPPVGFVDSYTSTAEPVITYSVNKDILRRIEIHVFPGFYDSETDRQLMLDLFPGLYSTYDVNLIYNHIDWYFHPGAIMYNYTFDDVYNDAPNTPGYLPLAGQYEYNDIVDTGIPVNCNVYGDGTFVSGGETQGYINIENSKTVFNFNAKSSNLQFYIINGNLNYSVKKQYFLLAGKFGEYFVMDGGKVNVDIEEAKWILNDAGWQYFSSAFYQGNGELNVKIKKYTAINIFDDGITAPPENISTFNGQYSNAGGFCCNPMFYSAFWDFNYYDQGVEDYAPNLGFFENYDVTQSATTKTNIYIDYGKFYGYTIQIYGGDVKFYPKTIEISAGQATFVIAGGNFGTLAFVGGPYYEGVVSKFSVFGGKIIYKKSPLISDTPYYSYVEGIEQFDEAQVYVKDTLFYFNPEIDEIYGNAIYRQYLTSGYQNYSLILDGVKYYCPTDPPSATPRYNFIAYTVDGSPLEIKIYGNCFSNFDPGIWYPNPNDDGPIPVGIVNVIPWTTMIIDSKVEII